MTAVAEPAEVGTVEEVTASYCALLADLVGGTAVAPDADLFADLGLDSMVVARFCARVRKAPGLPAVGVKAVYENPTLAGLARALTPSVERPAAPPPPAPQVVTPHLATRRAYALTGAAQALVFLAYSLLLGWVLTRGLAVISSGQGVVEVYLRAVAVGAAGFVLVSVLPVAVKWLLVGRWRETSVPAWSPAYLRFWVVKTLVRSNPLALLFVGTPLLPLYLRALGARIGPGVTVLTRTIPVCTDLLTIGAGSVVGKDSSLSCYRAYAGRIETGPVTLGTGVFVGEKTVLDIGTELGDGAQIGHASSLQRGQSVPAGVQVHGSPAQPTTVDYRRTPEQPVARRTRAAYGVAVVARLLLVLLPIGLGGGYLALAAVPALADLAAAEVSAAEIGVGRFLLDAVLLSLVTFAGSTLTGLALALVTPRLARPWLRPGVVYPLHGPRYGLHRSVARLTNLKFFTHMFGDSSYVVGYLRALGWQLTHVEQTGSNFGTEVGHETPWLSGVGRGTMVADGLSMMNAEYSSSSFRLAPVTIGARNFLGNNIAYPAGGRTGEDCLLATKVLVPLDGPVRQGVGLLGSPAFEIPRSVARDTRFDHLGQGEEGRRRLARKNRHNRRTIALFLLVRWGQFLLVGLLAMAALTAHSQLAEAAVSAFLAASVVLTAAYYVLVERLYLRFRPLQPQYCSIYDEHFWRHERYWKLPSTVHLAAFDGTPFKCLVWRALGVDIGSRVLDDGCFMTERTLASVGEGATLAQGSKLQSHSQEDGTFKSDHTRVGAGATLGVGAFVHYGVTVGAGAVVAADSFLMKGSEVAPGVVWAGNPAREV